MQRQTILIEQNNAITGTRPMDLDLLIKRLAISYLLISFLSEALDTKNQFRLYSAKYVIFVSKDYKY
jgi:hypothetical protein